MAQGEATLSLAHTLDAAETIPYLLVVESGSASMVPLADGDLLIGRTSEAHIRLGDQGCSRRHARLTVEGGLVRLIDLGSHNGTRVNGAAVREPRLLSSSDVIAIGEARLILQCGPRPLEPRPILDPRALRQRLVEEVARAVRYERPFTLVAVDLGNAVADGRALLAALDRELRIIDVVAREGDAQLVVLLPELPAEPGAAVAERMVAALTVLAPAARAGAASCPADGCRPDPLLAAARAAATLARPGRVTRAGDCATRIALGPTTALVADPAMIQVFELLRRLAASDLSVLIAGETGAGKENAAQALHHWSARADRPLVSINCATLPDTLVESELFGHEKGAFSGAAAAKPGRLETADGGTVFLDEVGELSPAAQAKLLRVLETRRIQRLGGLKEHAIDIRVVAATNRDLEAEVRAGRFREDLYFRLGAAKVNLPPLRARPRDLALLARLFLDEARRAAEQAPMSLSAAAMEALTSYRWPGNVRELKNEMRVVAATVSDTVVEPWHLPERICAAPPAAAAVAVSAIVAEDAAGAPARFRPIADELRELERRRMDEALAATGGVQTRAAELIGMPIRTFSMKLRQYGLEHRRAR
jgi:DNA-binding NtrC family response regulator